MRKTSITFTTRELELIVSLLKGHVTVAQFPMNSDQFKLFIRLQKELELARELEPV